MRARGLLLLLALCGAGALLWSKRADLASWQRGGRATVTTTPDTRFVSDTHDAPAATDARVWQQPPPPSGEFVDIELLGQPASAYGPGPEHGNDDAYEALLRDLAEDLGIRDVVYDRALARAAREVAYQTGVRGRTPPEAALTFLLHASGAPENSAAQFFTHSTSPDLDSDPDTVRDSDLDTVRDTLMRALRGPDTTAGQGVLRIGVGEVSTPDETYTRHVSVLAARRVYTIDAARRAVTAGATWSLSGRLPPGYHDVKASVLYPDNRMVTLNVDVDANNDNNNSGSGRRFTLAVPAESDPGTMYVSIDGTDERGPGKLLQLSVEIGRPGVEPPPLPRSTRVFVPETEPEFASLGDAEAYAVSLLIADRLRHGLPPLEPDPELADIARAHSREMRDRSFFAHLSPTTGLAGDRLQSAGYRTTMHAENLARNDTLGEAQAALMDSVGHRKNILDPNPSHIGIGLAEKRDGDRREWYVTQLFARPVRELDAQAVRADLMARIERERAARGVASVDDSERMSEVAAKYAVIVANGELQGVAQRALAELSDMHTTLSTTVHAIYDLERFELPDDVLAADITHVGVGVYQSADDPHGRTGVVLIMAYDP